MIINKLQLNPFILKESIHLLSYPMRISIYHNLKSRRSYSASTGLTPSEFDELAKDFCQLYQVAEHKFPENFGRPTAFSDGRELLFLLLYYKKMYPTFDVLALNFGISNATAHLYIQIAKALLKTVLAKRKLLPKRVFKDEQEFEKFSKILMNYLLMRQSDLYNDLVISKNKKNLIV